MRAPTSWDHTQDNKVGDMTNNGNLILNVENISYIRYNENVEFELS